MESKDSKNPSQGQKEQLEVQWKDSRLQPYLRWRRAVWRENYARERIMHLKVANTMAYVRTDWWIPKLTSKVKKVINQCNISKVFSTRPYGSTTITEMPSFRTKDGQPFKTGWVDLAGPLEYKITKKERGNYYVLFFSCSASRVVHQKVAVEEFQRKLNSFIARRKSPRHIIADNASAFKATASWMKKIRNSERLQDNLVREDITRQFNLSRSPWWEGMYERLIKNVKMTLRKTLGRAALSFEQLGAMIIDKGKHSNNRPLTYLEIDGGEEHVLTPNVLLWVQNVH